MSYTPNPFLSRMSERTVSDNEFVELFSPNILDQLEESILDGKVTIFRSPPGGGKTTLLRTFTPGPLRTIWDRKTTDSEAFKKLVRLNAISVRQGPNVLGVLISCSSGYADLPAGASTQQLGLFRALLNCRIILRCARSLVSFLRIGIDDGTSQIEVKYIGDSAELNAIPKYTNLAKLVTWAKNQEKKVYEMLDDFDSDDSSLKGAVRFEGVIWLNSVQFFYRGEEIAANRLIMIDDVHNLRKKQRSLLISELTEMRLNTPIWISMRDIAIGDDLLSQGIRDKREVRDISLQTIWADGQKKRYRQFAQNILDRRLRSQNVIAGREFSSFLLQENWYKAGYEEKLKAAFRKNINDLSKYENKSLYGDWLSGIHGLEDDCTISSLVELHKIKILIARNEADRQLAFDLSPIPNDELDARGSSALTGAAEIFSHNYDKMPYYYGMDKICKLSTNNIEELLSICGTFYDKLKAKNILGKDLHLTPAEQDKIVRDIAKDKRAFIANANTHGMRAQRLVDSMGEFCRKLTFRPSAPISPGVTGFRLSLHSIGELSNPDHKFQAEYQLLKSVLSECVAENTLYMKRSSASTNRLEGYVFYLNRTLCSHFKLPLGSGGWNEVEVSTLLEWISKSPRRQSLLK